MLIKCGPLYGEKNATELDWYGESAISKKVDSFDSVFLSSNHLPYISGSQPVI